MTSKEFFYKNKLILTIISICLILTGAIIGYLTFNNEPWETIGGFICGTGFGLFLIFVSLKEPEKQL